MRQFVHASGAISVTMDAEFVNLTMRLVVQSRRNDQDGLMLRYGAFPMVVGYGDSDSAAHAALEAQLQDYLQGFMDLNGPIGVLEQFQELGFSEAGDDWVPEVPGPVINQTLRATDGTAC